MPTGQMLARSLAVSPSLSLQAEAIGEDVELLVRGSTYTAHVDNMVALIV